MKCPNCGVEIESKQVIKEAMSQLGKRTTEKKKKANKQNGNKPKKKTNKER